MVDTLCPFPKDTLRTSYAIHPSAWKVDSANSIYEMLHIGTLGNRNTSYLDLVSREN
jgi:hypothetical protein